jgi:hypothetical protein
MNISQLSEQLKDVPQNRLIDYARNPNSVVPQFLALAEIQRRQQLSAQAQPPASTVANDVLQQAAPPQIDPRMLQAAAMQQAPQAAQMAQQLPENQPGVAQLPTGMPQGMAAGGIVAFAGGGMSLDDDEEDDREMARLFPQASASDLRAMIAALPANISGGVRSLADRGTQAVQAVKEGLPIAYEKVKAAIPQSYETAKEVQTIATPRGSHKYETAVLEEAKRQGVDPNLALHVLYKETGNLKDPESARSKAGAIGIMQLMPKTAAGLGVNPHDPMENIRGGIAYLKQMHSKYGDPRTAAAAYNAGPGNVDKALKRQGGLDTLSGETRNYIAGLAQGGSVKHFARAGEVESGTDNPYAMMGDIGVSSKNYTNYVGDNIIDRLRSKFNIKTAKEAEGEERLANLTDADRAMFAATQDMEDQEANKYAAIPIGQAPAPLTPYVPLGAVDIGFGPNKYAPEKVPEGPAPLTEAQQYAQELRDSIKAQAAAAAQNKKLQLGLSLLGAGAAGLQSGSRYLGQNIGASLAGGVGTYGALKKQEADEAKDILAARLGLYKIGAAEEGAKETRELTKAYREGETERKTTEAKYKDQDRNIQLANAYYTKKISELDSRYSKMVGWGIDPKLMEAYNREKAAIANDPKLQYLDKLAYPGLDVAQTSPVAGSRPPLGSFNK